MKSLTDLTFPEFMGIDDEGNGDDNDDDDDDDDDDDGDDDDDDYDSCCSGVIIRIIIIRLSIYCIAIKYSVQFRTIVLASGKETGV